MDVFLENFQTALEITLRFFPENPLSMHKFAMQFFGLTMTPPLSPLFGHFFQNLRPKYTALKTTKSALYFLDPK